MSEPYGIGNLPPAVELNCETMPSLTQQQFAEEADINFIMNRFIETGFLADTDTREDLRDVNLAEFGEISYLDCWNKVQAGKAAFDSLPSALRARFNNDPHELIVWLQSGANEVEAEALGIVTDAPINGPA